MRIQKLLTVAGALLMAATLLAVPAAGQARDPGVTDRIALADPVSGAVQISQIRFPTLADHVVLATTASFADSLTAAALTADGPLLLTSPSTLLPAVAEEMDRVLPDGGLVYLLGGTAALDDEVESAVRARGHDVRRLAGDTRLTTGIAVAREVAARYGTGATVVVARAFGDGTAAWADSVTGGAWAAARRVPLLLTPTEGLDAGVGALLEELGTTESIVLGGVAAVSTEVEVRLPGGRRVAGDERSGTAAAIAEQLWGPSGGYLVINGYVDGGWTAGLPAAGLAADRGEPVLVADTDRVPQPTLARLGLGCESGPPQILTTLIGGVEVLADEVVAAIDQQDGGACPAPPPPPPPPAVAITGSGLTIAALGTSGDDAVAAVTAALGEPTYISPEYFPFCETFGGGRGREYEWGDVLSLYIIDPDANLHDNPAGSGRTEFWGGLYGGFTYDPSTETFIQRPDTLGLQTDRGIGLGATGAEVMAAYGADATFHPGKEEGYPPPGWELPGRLFSFNDTNDPQTTRIETFLLGNGCGE